MSESQGDFAPLTTLPDAQVGQPYLATVPTLRSNVGTSVAWTLLSGALPPGLGLGMPAQAPNTITGMPTLAGRFDFTLEALVNGNRITQIFELIVQPNASLVDGWTEFVPQPGARVVHVSSSGNDSASGSVTAPRRTLAGGFALLRNGQADWLLLKRGDSFSLNSTFQWNKSGPATGNGWMRLGAYGDDDLPRPVLLSQGGFIAITPGYQSSATIQRVAITDIYLSAANRIATSATTTQNINGVHLVATQWQGTGMPFSRILLENCRISGFTFGLICETDSADVSVRRCIFDHIFAIGSPHSSAILSSAQGFLFEDNVIYKVMSPDIPGLGNYANSSFSHTAYIGSFATNVIARGNIVIKAPDGTMQRGGGEFSRNVCAKTHNGTNIGQAWGVTPAPGGVQIRVEENLLLNTNSHVMYVGNTASGAVRANLLLQDQDGSGQTDMSLVSINSTNTGTNIGVHNTAFTDNLLSGTITWNPSNVTSFTGLSFSGNLQNAGPTTTSVAAYLAAIGWPGTTVDDWANKLLLRDRANFTREYLSTSIINFYRQHYALPPLQ